MDLARHCTLCDNQLVNIKDGTTCGLTNKKPEFNKTCIKIELNDKFEQRVKKVNIELENVNKMKTDTYGHVVIFTLISIAVVFGGYYIGKYAFESGVISTVPLVIMAIGLGILVFAIGPLNKYRNELAIVKSNKEKLDEVLKLYKIDYDIDLAYGEKIHGTREVRADLRIKRT